MKNKCWKDQKQDTQGFSWTPWAEAEEKQVHAVWTRISGPGSGSLLSEKWMGEIVPPTQTLQPSPLWLISQGTKKEDGGSQSIKPYLPAQSSTKLIMSTFTTPSLHTHTQTQQTGLPSHHTFTGLALEPNKLLCSFLFLYLVVNAAETQSELW